MRFSLVNPAWDFAGSIYFGCREAHLPLEYGYSRDLLEKAGHDVQLVDAQLEGLTAISSGDAHRPSYGFREKPWMCCVTSAAP
jgi:hypothetical protein